jgi:hypothetical protein
MDVLNGYEYIKIASDQSSDLHSQRCVMKKKII